MHAAKDDQCWSYKAASDVTEVEAFSVTFHCQDQIGLTTWSVNALESLLSYPRSSLPLIKAVILARIDTATVT